MPVGCRLVHGRGPVDAPGIEVCLEGLQQLQTLEEAQDGGRVGRTGGGGGGGGENEEKREEEGGGKGFREARE